MFRVNLIAGPWNKEALGVNRVWYQLYSQLARQRGVQLSLLALPYPHYRAEYLLLYGALPLQLLVRRRVLFRGVNHFVRQHYAHVLNWLRLPCTVVTCHDLAEVQGLESGLAPYRRLRRQHIRAYHSGMLKADRIVTVSEYLRGNLIDQFGYPPERVTTVHPGVDASLFHPLSPDVAVLRKYGVDPAGTYVLYVGSEKARKNLPLLTRAFHLLCKDLPDVKMLKVGKPQHVQGHGPLLEEVNRLGLKGRFRLIGEDLPDSELVHLYNAAKLFVFPSRLEGFGLPPLEAMACGVPVIVANATSLPEVVGEAGLLVQPDDPETLARLMRRVLTDRDLARRLARLGLQRAQCFTPGAAASRMRAVYETLWEAHARDQGGTR